MATSPTFPQNPSIGFTKLTSVDATASKNHDGTGSATVAVFTAGASGSRVDQIVAASLGTNVVSVLRVFINNGSANTTSTNNTLLQEATLAATTISEVAQLNTVTISLGIALPPGYKIYVCLGTAVAAGWSVTCMGGDY